MLNFPFQNEVFLTNFTCSFFAFQNTAVFLTNFRYPISEYLPFKIVDKIQSGILLQNCQQIPVRNYA